MIDAGHAVTSNGDLWDISGNAYSSFQINRMRIMVNGTLMINRPAWTGQIAELTDLGIPVTEIERIEIILEPGFYLGEFNTQGIIHIITQQAKSGSFFNRGIYTTGRTFEGDQPTGQNLGQSLGYRGLNYAVAASFVIYSNHEVDTSNTNKPIKHGAFRLQFNQFGKKTEHQVMLMTYGVDLYSTYLGYIRLNNHHGLRGAIELCNSYDQVNFRSNFYHQYRRPRLKDNLTIQTGVISTYSTYHQPPNYIAFNSGSSFTRYVQKQEYPWSVYFNVSLPLTRKAILHSEFQYLHDIRPGFNATLTLYKRLNVLANWSLVASYAEFGPAGLTFLIPNYKNNFWGVHTSLPDENNSQFVFDANYSMNVGTNFKVHFTTGWRSGVQYYAASPYSYATGTGTILISPGIATITHQVWTSRFNIHYDVLKNMFIDMNYFRISQLNNNDPEATSGIPKHKFTVLLNSTLPWKLQLWTRAYYQSTSDWYGMPTSFQPNKMSLPHLYLLDMGLGRRFFKDHLIFNFSARNITNSSERYIPTALTLPARYTISLGYQIGS